MDCIEMLKVNRQKQSHYAVLLITRHFTSYICTNFMQHSHSAIRWATVLYPVGQNKTLNVIRSTRSAYSKYYDIAVNIC